MFNTDQSELQMRREAFQAFSLLGTKVELQMPLELLLQIGEKYSLPAETIFKAFALVQVLFYQSYLPQATTEEKVIAVLFCLKITAKLEQHLDISLEQCLRGAKL